MAIPLFPTLYQINTRIWLAELGVRLGRKVTLLDVPQSELDALAARGFDWVWLLGIWQTGLASRQVSASSPAFRQGYAVDLPDFTDADICGSPFAIREYRVHDDFGGNAALALFRVRLAERGIKLLLDFVPNHTALDHPWTQSHPEFYIDGSADDLIRQPQNYTTISTPAGERIIAHGRDPYFPGWADTLQLNYRHAGFRRAMLAELSRIAMQCDGLRCDMAMLLLPDVIARTWGERSLPSDGTRPVDQSFWPEAISALRSSHRDFLFMAEVYWDLEWQLQQEGFDYTYDKRLADRLHAQNALAVRGHLQADAEFQRRSVRFLENHDEPRAAFAFSPEVHPAAALIAMLVPGLRLFHDGQLEGRTSRASIHLSRRQREPVDESLRAFYDKLLGLLRLPQLRSGTWRLLDVLPAWEGNHSHEPFLVFWWNPPAGASNLSPLLVVVNYAATRGQCYAQWPTENQRDERIFLIDLLHPTSYERERANLLRHGLYLDMPAWGTHVFEVRG